MTQPAPTPAQQRWMQLEYGLFVHFGPNTFEGKPWGDGTFPADRVDLRPLDTRQWARLAADAGMKVAVLTAKHHDGFCLWPSRHTDYSVRHASGARDVVAEFADSFRREGLKVGLYYSLWDRHCPAYADDAAYAAYMRDQVTELLTGYGEIVQLWFDGGWDKDYPSREWEFDPAWERDPAAAGYAPGRRWEWRALYEHIHRLQPDTIVMNNSSSDRPGIPRCFPLDARTSEHFDFAYKGRTWSADTTPYWKDDTGRPVYLPLEYDVTVSRDWFYIENSWYVHPSAATICDWYRRARAVNANLMLNVGPTPRGVIPEYHRPYFEAAARELFR